MLIIILPYHFVIIRFFMEQQNIFHNRIDLQALSETVSAIRQEVGKLIIGQHKMVDLLITAILADGHVLIEGVPGVAKTLTAKILSRILSIDFSRIQFTPDLMPSDVLGTSIFNLKTSEFNFKKGPVFSNLVLIDEINRSPAKTQAALFEVMEERQITIDGTRYDMSPPFMVLATQNPVEHEGTYRLPEAQLDRFLFKIEVGYPNLEEEVQMLTGFHLRNNQNDLSLIQPLLSAEQIVAYRQRVTEIHVEPHLLRYIAQIISKTRQNAAIFLGASPRASIALLRGSKAFAAVQGRDFVTPEDIQAIVLPVLRHRIMLTAEKEMEGIPVDAILQQLISQVEVPR
jgi:MoxR-like ATPase